MASKMVKIALFTLPAAFADIASTCEAAPGGGCPEEAARGSALLQTKKGATLDATKVLTTEDHHVGSTRVIATEEDVKAEAKTLARAARVVKANKEQLGQNASGWGNFAYYNDWMYGGLGATDSNIFYRADGFQGQPSDFGGTAADCYNVCMAQTEPPCLAFTFASPVWRIKENRWCLLHTQLGILFHRPQFMLGLPNDRRVDMSSSSDFVLQRQQECLAQVGVTFLMVACDATDPNQHWYRTIDGVYVNRGTDKCISNNDGNIEAADVPTGLDGQPQVVCAKKWYGAGYDFFPDKLYLEHLDSYPVPDAENEADWDGVTFREFWEPGAVHEMNGRLVAKAFSNPMTYTEVPIHEMPTTAPPTTPAPTPPPLNTDPATISDETLVGMIALSAIVHHDVSIEPHFYEGWTKETEVSDIHESLLGLDVDHATVYSKGCDADGQCNECAIAFTATVDAWDLMQDMNITTTPFCGLTQAHGGFVDEMRGFMRNETWGTAMDFLKTRCTGTNYAVGTSLGGALASLFAFCANRHQQANDNIDASHFAGLPTFTLVSFGAPSVAKEEVYSGAPNGCFDGVRVAITPGHYPVMTHDFLGETIYHTSVLTSVMHTERAVALKHTLLAESQVLNAIPNNDAAGLAAFKARFVRAHMSDVIIETTTFLIGMIGGELDIGAVLPLLDTIWWLSPNINDPNPNLEFEFDATTALLQELDFQHPRVAFREAAHPKGTEEVVTNDWAASPCNAVEQALAPQAELMLTFWGTLGSLGIKEVKKLLSGSSEVPTPVPPNKDFSAGFPNHHLCCYLLAITGQPESACGANPATGVPYKCDEPSWR